MIELPKSELFYIRLAAIGEKKSELTRASVINEKWRVKKDKKELELIVSFEDYFAFNFNVLPPGRHKLPDQLLPAKSIFITPRSPCCWEWWELILVNEEQDGQAVACSRCFSRPVRELENYKTTSGENDFERIDRMLQLMGYDPLTSSVTASLFENRLRLISQKLQHWVAIKTPELISIDELQVFSKINSGPINSESIIIPNDQHIAKYTKTASSRSALKSWNLPPSER